MNFDIPLMQWSENAWFMHVYFLSLRLAAILILTPVLYAAPLPVSVRTILILSLSIAIAAGFSNASIPATALPSGVGSIIAASIKELVLGATLAIGILVAFASISIAGRMLDIQIGFGMAQVFDPLTRQQLPILTSAFNQIGVIFFFLIDAHHTLLRAVAFSVERFPLGQSWDISLVALPVLKQVGILFSLGFALASPIVFCVLLVELALGVVARNLPQMNMFVMGVPIKVTVGLLTLSIWFVGMGGVLRRIHGSIFQTWDWIFSTQINTLSLLTQSGVIHG
jgi:flagellar biosynthetic protein FliR